MTSCAVGLCDGKETAAGSFPEFPAARGCCKCDELAPRDAGIPELGETGAIRDEAGDMYAEPIR